MYYFAACVATPVARAQGKPAIDQAIDSRQLAYTTSVLLLSAQVAQSIWLPKCAAHAILASGPQGLEGLGGQAGDRSELLVVHASSVRGGML